MWTKSHQEQCRSKTLQGQLCDLTNQYKIYNYLVGAVKIDLFKFLVDTQPWNPFWNSEVWYLHVPLIGKDLTYTCTQNEKCCAKHVFWFVWGQFLSDDDREFSSSAEEQKHQEGPCLHKVKKMADKAVLLKSILVHGAPMFQPKYVPQCDEEGYYAPMQCMMDKSKCWCVDRLGNKIKKSRERRTRGKPEELDCSWIESSSHKDACYMYR